MSVLTGEARRAPSGLGFLRVLLAVAIAVSIVHYADNVAAYGAYPEPASGFAPSRGLIAASWFVFTALGLAGYVLLRRGRVLAAAACLAAYSGSGLIGFGHYTVEGATGMPWWRHTHIVADIACGIAVLTFAFWLLRRRDAGRSRAAGAGS